MFSHNITNLLLPLAVQEQRYHVVRNTAVVKVYTKWLTFAGRTSATSPSPDGLLKHAHYQRYCCRRAMAADAVPQGICALIVDVSLAACLWAR